MDLDLNENMLKKKQKKSLISETIKRIIPERSPCCTESVCCPSKVPSRITSRHQKITFRVAEIRPRVNRFRPIINPCIYLARPNTIKNTVNATRKGQGLGSTI